MVAMETSHPVSDTLLHQNVPRYISGNLRHISPPPPTPPQFEHRDLNDKLNNLGISSFHPYPFDCKQKSSPNISTVINPAT